MRVLLVTSLVVLASCATTSSHTTYPPRLQTLEQSLALADQYPCTQGLQPIPATPIEVGVFGRVPYHSFSNGNVEVNLYGDPGDLVGVEAGTRLEDEGLKQCLVQFAAATALLPEDQARVQRLGTQPAVDRQPNLTVEVTPRNGPDAYDAWWISLERVEAIAASRAPVEQLTIAESAWVAPPVTYYRRPYRPFVRYRPYRPARVRVYVPSYTRSRGGYVHRAVPVR